MSFAPFEAVRIGRALEELERPKAKERHRQNGGDKVSEKAAVKKEHSRSGDPPAHERKTRHIVGQAVGMSGPSYDRAKAVVAAAEEDLRADAKENDPPIIGGRFRLLFGSGCERVRGAASLQEARGGF